MPIRRGGTTLRWTLALSCAAIVVGCGGAVSATGGQRLAGAASGTSNCAVPPASSGGWTAVCLASLPGPVPRIQLAAEVSRRPPPARKVTFHRLTPRIEDGDVSVYEQSDSVSFTPLALGDTGTGTTCPTASGSSGPIAGASGPSGESGRSPGSPACSNELITGVEGQLAPILVTDNLGTADPWSLTGQLESDFSNGAAQGPLADNEILAANLLWEPEVLDGPSSAEVAPGPVSALSSADRSDPDYSSTASVLCQAAEGTVSPVSCAAELVLAVPPYVSQGVYGATLDLVIS